MSIQFFGTSISWENTKYDLRDIPTTYIMYLQQKIDAEVNFEYRYGDYWGSPLQVISLKIPYQEKLENDLTHYYGERYIHVYNTQTGYYHKTWLLDSHYVAMECRRFVGSGGYLYVRLERLNYRKSYHIGAYFEKPQPQKHKGFYSEIVTNLSFYGISLGEHKTKVITSCKNNKNLLNIVKTSASTYLAKIHGIIPETNKQIHFNAQLIFYRDTLAYIGVTTSDSNAESYTKLYIEKYKSEKAELGGGKWIGEVDYNGGKHREQRTHYKWIFRNQSIGLTEEIDIYETGRRKYKGLKIEYKQNQLYEEWCNKESLMNYENQLKEEKRKRDADLADSIRIANQKMKMHNFI